MIDTESPKYMLIPGRNRLLVFISDQAPPTLDPTFPMMHLRYSPPDKRLCGDQNKAKRVKHQLHDF